MKKTKLNKTNNKINFCWVENPTCILTFKKLLTNVTKHVKNRQLSELTCFIIHVGSICIGEKTYA